MIIQGFLHESTINLPRNRNAYFLNLQTKTDKQGLIRADGLLILGSISISFFQRNNGGKRKTEMKNAIVVTVPRDHATEIISSAMFELIMGSRAATVVAEPEISGGRSLIKIPFPASLDVFLPKLLTHRITAFAAVPIPIESPASNFLSRGKPNAVSNAADTMAIKGIDKIQIMTECPLPFSLFIIMAVLKATSIAAINDAIKTELYAFSSSAPRSRNTI